MPTKFYSMVWAPEQVVAPLLVFLAPVEVGITCSGKERLPKSLSPLQAPRAEGLRIDEEQLCFLTNYNSRHDMEYHI